MSASLADEIIQARKLFEKYEKSQDHEMRTTFYVEAIELLKGYQEENPESPHNTLIENLKKTYLLKLIRELPTVPADNINEWYGYVNVLLMDAETVNRVLKEDSPLKENLVSFMEVYKDEFQRILDKSLKKKRPELSEDSSDA